MLASRVSIASQDCNALLQGRRAWDCSRLRSNAVSRGYQRHRWIPWDLFALLQTSQHNYMRRQSMQLCEVAEQSSRQESQPFRFLLDKWDVWDVSYEVKDKAVASGM